MVKFPSQNRLQYVTGELSNDTFSSVGYINLPKDLSILNRRGYNSTDSKGVPLVFRVQVTLSQHDLDGKQAARDDNASGTTSDDDVAETANAADNATLIRMLGCQNNWVMKNASVKLTAAWKKMFKREGISRRDLGAYNHHFRFEFDSANQSWLAPYDGDGAQFTGGTWDVTHIITEQDNDLSVKIVGSGVDEESGYNDDALSLGHSYLMSRGQVPADTNLAFSEETPARYSILNSLLVGSSLSATLSDDVQTQAQDAQDNPPYELIDISDSGDVDHDITEPVELGRVIAGAGNAIGTAVMDVPFGLMKLEGRHAGATDQGIVDPVAFSIQVIDIYPMQG